MAIRFYCPACHKPLAVARNQAGTQSACPACKAELIVPTESTRPKPEQAGADTPAAAGPAAPVSPSRPLRLRAAALAAALLVVAGLGVGIPLVFRGDRVLAEQAQVQPVGEPEDEAAAQLDQVANARETRGPRPTEPDVATPDEDEKPEGAALPPAVSAFDVPATPASPPAVAPRPEGEMRQAAPAAPAVKAPPRQNANQTVRERWASKRRSRLTDDELRLELVLPPEVDLEAVPGTTKKLITVSGKSAATGVDVVPQFTARRADLLGLPLRPGLLARMGSEEALNLKVLSQVLRFQVQTSIPGAARDIVDPRPDPDLLRKQLLDTPQQQATWLRPQAISTLRQLLMHDHRNVRLILVELLSRIDGRAASVALAERAVFDLNPDVRLAALVALKNRPTFEYEAALIAGLRYPWPAAADHAAEALVALDLRDAVPKVASLLDARDLSEPYPVDVGGSRRAMVPELVRINHLRNCLLCHAYSGSANDPVRGLVPHAEHLVPLPASGSRAASTSNSKWGGGSSGPTINLVTPTFVRADITFLRQDFSVVQPVPNHGRLWPADQRYDYLVRLRPLNADGLVAWQDKLRDLRSAEPQRESLLYALRELTGEDLGPTVEDWKRYYSPITGKRFSKPLDPNDQVVHLRECLAEATPMQQAERLAMFRDKGGPAYDIALALAIPQLGGELQKLGRAVLADRFWCLPLQQLRTKLSTQDAEMRRAAVTVCKQRKLKTLTPELIPLLDDVNEDVAMQAHQVLQKLAGRDFGPRPGANREARQQAMAAWREWWEKQPPPKDRPS
jgi:hypothetical protein